MCFLFGGWGVIQNSMIEVLPMPVKGWSEKAIYTNACRADYQHVCKYLIHISCQTNGNKSGHLHVVRTSRLWQWPPHSPSPTEVAEWNKSGVAVTEPQWYFPSHFPKGRTTLRPTLHCKSSCITVSVAPGPSYLQVLHAQFLLPIPTVVNSGKKVS